MCLPAFEDSVETVAERMCDTQCRKRLQSLNKTTEIFTHVMHIAKSKSQQLTCCLHGGAGTGKSHVLTVLYQGLYHLLCEKAGQNQEDYRILVIAPTDKAAFNVKGSTIHSALHVPVNQASDEYKKLSHDALSTYQMKYRHLKWILCDQFSMVSNIILKYMYLHLQDIKCSNKLFGGTNIIAIGGLVSATTC